MNRVRWGSLIVGLGLLTGCHVKYYKEPDISAPHALLKVRILYHEQSGPNLTEGVGIDQLPLKASLTGTQEASTRAVRIAPGAHRIKIANKFWHSYTTSRTVYTTESYSCGTSGSYRTCTRSVTRTVYDTHYVTDGECEMGADLLPRADEIYLLQYDYFEHNKCSLSCYRQQFQGGSEFQLVPCD